MKKLYAIVFIAILCCSGLGMTQAQSGEELARAYIEARINYTVDPSIMTDDVEIVELGDPVSVEELASWLEYAKAIGLTWFIEGCDTKTATEVNCRFTMSNKVSNASGYGQVDGGVFQFSIEDEKIAKVNLDINLEFWGPNVFRKTMNFLERNHQADLSKMFTDKGTIGVSEEGLELWRIHTDELAAVLQTSVSPTEELARAYIEARNNYDIETTKTLLTEDTKIIELGDEYSIETLTAFLAYAKAQDFRWEVDSCTTNDIGIYDVACSYVVSNSISNALEIDPIPGGTVSFKVEDDKISLVNLVYPIDVWGPNVFSMMIGFIRANHQSDFPKLLPDNFPNGISEEGLGLWRSYTDEFVETMSAAKANTTTTASEQIGFDFLEARGNWDAEALFALMADDFESYDLQRASSLEDYQDAVAYYKALNWNWTAKRCDDIGQTGDVHKVMCVAELSNDLSRGLNNGSYNMGWGLEIQNDKIIGIYPEWNRTFVNNNLEPFRGYLLKNHNKDLQKIYSQSSQFLPRGEEALGLLKTYVAEFLATQE